MTGAPIVTLLTDFGLTDPYVGVMKGVILSAAPSARIIDITHGAPPQDIATASVYLASATRYFPERSVHVAVVDPGVGGPRRAIVVETIRAWYVAPDNGLLSGVVADEEVVSIIDVTDSPALSRDMSATFHGRDVFAPVAGRIARGTPLGELGRPVDEIVTMDVYALDRDGDALVGRVLFADHFGNLVTNVRRADVGVPIQDVRLHGADMWTVGAPVAYYGAVADGEPLTIWNSFGLLEIAINGGSMADAIGWSPGVTPAVSVRL